MKKIFPVLFPVLLLAAVLPVLAAITCEVRADSCQSGYVDVFRMSNTTDAHAELRTGSAYSYLACCKETYGVTASLGTACTGQYNVTLLNLSGATNAHAMLNNETSGYNNAVCLNSTSNLSFAYATSCAGYDGCIASVSGNTNAHVGNCSAYSTLLCVQTRNMTVAITEGNATAVATRGYQAQSLTVRFYDAARGVYPSGISGRIWINSNGTYRGYSCVSNTGGNCTIQFDPDCSFAGGKTNWRGGVYSDSSYNDMNSTDGEITIDVEPSCVQTVTFRMEFNISGTDGDSGEVDGKGTGFYRANDTANYYSCVQDSSGNVPAFGIAFAGTELNYINLTSGSQGGSYRMSLSQFQSDNRFILPATISGCSAIQNRLPSVQHGLLTQPIVAFVSMLKNPLEIILSYPDLDIVGDFSKSGAFTITLEKGEANGITQIIVRD